MSPNDYKNSLAVFMRQRAMYGEYNLFGEMIATKHAGHGNDIALWGEEVYETYNTLELRGNYYFREKWKTTLILPFVSNRQQVGSWDRYTVNGLGDPILMESYQIYNTKRDTSSKSFSQRLTAGLGIKIPLGKTDIRFNHGTPNLDLQPGSGSWDGLGYIAYMMKWKFLGANANVNAKFNGKDKLNYQYGRVYNITANLFTDLNVKSVTVRFLAGLYLERAKMDRTIGTVGEPSYIHKNTGGTILFANTGIQIFTDRFLLFGEYQPVVKSNLNGFSQLLTLNKLNIGLTYNF